MKHVFRFLGEVVSDGRWRVSDEDELKHGTKVLRLGAGDFVEVFNGKGQSAGGMIETVGANGIEVVTGDPLSEVPLRPSIHLAVGALKTGDIDELLPGLVECGVDLVHVFLQEGTEKFRVTDKATERWQRVVLSACKQAKRSWLPQVKVHHSLGELIDQIPASGIQRFVLQPGAPRSLVGETLREGEVLALLGGERGLNDAERSELTRADFVGVSLGAHVLRAKTAALAAAAILGSRRDV